MRANPFGNISFGSIREEPAETEEDKMINQRPKTVKKKVKNAEDLKEFASPVTSNSQKTYFSDQIPSHTIQNLRA